MWGGGLLGHPVHGTFVSNILSLLASLDLKSCKVYMSKEVLYVLDREPIYLCDYRAFVLRFSKGCILIYQS